MAIAAYGTVVQTSGAPVTFTGATTSAYTAGDWVPAGFTSIMQLDDVTKRVIDPTAAVTVYVGGVPQAGGIDYLLDPLFGRVAFAVAPIAAVTVDGKYLPGAAVAEVRDFSLKASATALDRTTFDSAGNKQHLNGLHDLAFTMSALFDPDHAGAAAPGALFFVEVQPGGTGAKFRAWVRIESAEVKGSVDGLIEYSLSCVGTHNEVYDASGRLASAKSFGWGT